MVKYTDFKRNDLYFESVKRSTPLHYNLKIECGSRSPTQMFSRLPGYCTQKMEELRPSSVSQSPQSPVAMDQSSKKASPS